MCFTKAPKGPTWHLEWFLDSSHARTGYCKKYLHEPRYGLRSWPMRVLVVSAHRSGDRPDKEGQRRFAQFLRILRNALSSVAGVIGSPAEIAVRSIAQLAEFVPPAPLPGTAASAEMERRLQSFDSLDMVFVEGASSLHPWKSSAAPLLRLLVLCVTVGKPLFGTVSNLLAYLANVGPVPLTLRAGTLSSFGPPDDGGARLDKRTGDLFAWCSRHGAWIPIGNVIRSRCATCPPHSSRRC